MNAPRHLSGDITLCRMTGLTLQGIVFPKLCIIIIIIIIIKGGEGGGQMMMCGIRRESHPDYSDYKGTSLIGNLPTRTLR